MADTSASVHPASSSMTTTGWGNPRWGRSTQDLAQTLGLSFDLGTAYATRCHSSGFGRGLRKMRGTADYASSIMAGLAEFERDLIRERVRSGIDAARARGARHAPRRAELSPDRPQSGAKQKH